MFKDLIKTVQEKSSVGKAGKTIIKGKIPDLFFRLFHLGTVMHNAKEHLWIACFRSHYFPVHMDMSGPASKDYLKIYGKCFALANCFFHRGIYNRFFLANYNIEQVFH